MLWSLVRWTRVVNVSHAADALSTLSDDERRVRASGAGRLSVNVSTTDVGGPPTGPATSRGAPTPRRGSGASRPTAMQKVVRIGFGTATRQLSSHKSLTFASYV
jgi:hypothetical protein